MGFEGEPLRCGGARVFSCQATHAGWVSSRGARTNPVIARAVMLIGLTNMLLPVASALLMAPLAPRCGRTLTVSMHVVDIRMKAATSYTEYAQSRTEEGDESADESSPQPVPLDAPPPKIDPALLQAAKQAAVSAGLADRFNGTQIVSAFNNWKVSLDKSYGTADEEASDLSTFAVNADLISDNLESTTFSDDDLGLTSPGIDWRSVYNQAANQRANAETERATAITGKAEANDKLRQDLMANSKIEESAVLSAQAAYASEVNAAEEMASKERSRLAQKLAQVAIEQREAQMAAEQRMTSTVGEAKSISAKGVAAAEADQQGEMERWGDVEAASLQALKAAEVDMANALARAKEQEAAAQAAAKKRAAAALEARSEAKTLREMLRQTQEKAASDVARAETERREMELAVEQANKRAQKAKAAAAAALEEL